MVRPGLFGGAAGWMELSKCVAQLVSFSFSLAEGSLMVAEVIRHKKICDD